MSSFAASVCYLNETVFTCSYDTLWFLDGVFLVCLSDVNFHMGVSFMLYFILKRQNVKKHVVFEKKPGLSSTYVRCESLQNDLVIFFRMLSYLEYVKLLYPVKSILISLDRKYFVRSKLWYTRSEI